MQCGKCKKAYYCSMTCFNNHLPEHQKYCGTKEIFSQPSGSAVEMSCKRKPITDSDFVKDSKAQDAKPALKRKAPKKKKSKSKKKQTKDSATEELSVADLESSEVAKADVNAASLASISVPESAEEEEEFDITELSDKMSALAKIDANPRTHGSVSKMNHSFADFGRNIALAPDDSFSKETVELRHAELFQREYSWMTPEWINMQLKKTPKGRELLESGNLSQQPVTDIRMLLEEGLITWEKPAWTKPKLRQTPQGQKIKDEALELENSFREEFGHKSFCS